MACDVESPTGFSVLMHPLTTEFLGAGRTAIQLFAFFATSIPGFSMLPRSWRSDRQGETRSSHDKMACRISELWELRGGGERMRCFWAVSLVLIVACTGQGGRDHLLPEKADMTEAEFQAFLDAYQKPFMDYAFAHSDIIGQLRLLMNQPRDSERDWIAAQRAIGDLIKSYESIEVPADSYGGHSISDEIRTRIQTLDSEIKHLLNSHSTACEWMASYVQEHDESFKEKADEAMNEAMASMQVILEQGRTLPELFPEAVRQAQAALN